MYLISIVNPHPPRPHPPSSLIHGGTSVHTERNQPYDRSSPLGHWDGGWRTFVRRRGRPPPQCLRVRVRVWIRKRLWLNCCVIWRDTEGIRFYIFTFLDILFYILIFPRHVTFLVLQWKIFSWEFFLKKNVPWHATARCHDTIGVPSKLSVKS